MRGAVKLWTFTEDPLAVKRYGPLATKDGARQFEVTHAREAKGHLVATLKGIATREDAERLNGIELYIARDKLPATDEDEYYHADLIGLAAVNAEDEPLGRVIAIHNFGAGDIIEIAPPHGATMLLPFTNAVVPTVDLAGGPRGDRIARGDRGRRSFRRVIRLSADIDSRSRAITCSQSRLGIMAMTNTHKAFTHKAWRLHAHNDLRFDDVETPAPASDGVVVRIEAGMVLSYTDRVLSGSVPYSLPPMPFVPGTNAIARVVAAGGNVTHVRSGDRVFLSPHLRGDVPIRNRRKS